MERISIFNYEAFYLDFLEGNLSEEDTVLLFEFLEKHPELKLEDDILVTLNDEQPKLDNSFKAGLKQIEINEATITEENMEHFMIAETEGLLTEQKLKELDRFVGSDNEKKKLRRTFAATRLKPDVRVVFDQKDSLKRGRRIALWPVISFAAAACAIALFLLWDPADSAIERQIDRTVAQNQMSDAKPNITPSNTNVSTESGSVNNAPIQVAMAQTVGNSENVGSTNEKATDQVKMDVLEIKRPTTLPEKSSDPQIIQTTYSKPQQTQVSSPVDDYTVLGFDDMKNPIKPITNRLADVVKQEVDFRTAKPTEKRSGGFYVKIGKFELSHKKFH